jgi:uncharacterized damage-inducible protein DinB
MEQLDQLREQLVKYLNWQEAHASFDSAIEGIPSEKYGVQPEGLPFSPWQLLEHLRITQHDIVDFCINPNYTEPKWPDDYWSATVAPPTVDAWAESVAAYRADLEQFQQFVANPELDLFATIPHGSGQTYLREVLLIVDHAAYHIGQIVAVRRLLGVWG